MKTYHIKRGSKLDLTVKALSRDAFMPSAPLEPINLTGITVTSEAKRMGPKGLVLVETLLTTVVDQDIGHIRLEAGSDKTNDWPAEGLFCDVKLTSISDPTDVVFLPTFRIWVDENVTSLA